MEVRQRAAAQGNELFCMFEGKQMSWREFDQRSNQVANLFKSLNIQRGDSIAFFMDNRLENLTHSLGIVKLGAICSFINTSLTDNPLKHCINLVHSKKIIFGEELMDAINQIRSELPYTKDDYLFVPDNYEGRVNRPCPEWATDMSQLLAEQPDIDLQETADIQLKDIAYYIFTSGTTGLPKASIITHDRWLRMGTGFASGGFKLEPGDRIYVALPLYHSSAQFIGYGAALKGGVSIFLRRKFSASNWVDEARKYQTNCFVYIGEVCRYLMDTPERPDDHTVPVTKVVGNGLRPDIWMEFKKRFGIERVGEFYGASEGNAGCVNLFNRDKTIGFCTAPHALIEYDIMEDKIVLDQNGFCKKVRKGEPGLMIAEITSKARFDGYSNKEASEKKIMRNVFKQGDQYFNTGDLLRQVDVGFAFGLPHYEFVDRVGDTFRWKGENVSTNEIGEILNQHTDVIMSNVYGVEIPGTDGRAGMAALTLKDQNQFDVKSFSALVKNKIPSYAQPLFLRILPEMETTGTHKLMKGTLREQAYHLDQVEGDAIYVLKPKALEYTLLDDEFYKDIVNGKSGF
jgi:citronellyl-CoA synthetase